MSNQTVAIRNRTLDDVVGDARDRYVAANPKSAARHSEAAEVMPGGNTRAVLYYPPFPVAMVGGEGALLTDLDGHVYTDFVSEYGAGILGHSNPKTAEAARNAMARGILLGAPNLYEARLARLFVERFPAVDKIRFCNSGTEANLLALGTAIAHTGRSKVMVFREGYHGGILTFAHGGSELNAPFDFVFADYNDPAGTVGVIAETGKELAAVIVEPMMGGGGSIPGTTEFLSALREATRRTGALLIFDEVITSRLAPGGLHGKHGILPDLVTFGKYLGGGFSFGAFGGADAIMAHFDPTRSNHFSHGGTFNNNVATMSAGIAVLEEVFTASVCSDYNRRGDALRDAINETALRFDVAVSATGMGSALNIHFQREPILSPADIRHDREAQLTLYYLEMMLKGFYVTPRGMINLNIELTDDDCRRFTEALEELFRDFRFFLQD